jgi:hypothetical protein
VEISLHELAEAIERIEGARRSRDERPVGSGFAEIDRLLPEGGFPRGTLVEYVAACAGSGAASLALAAAGSALADGGALVVIDREQTFYPLAVAAWGIEIERLILVRPENDRDERWALEQVLRSPAVAAALAWPVSKQGKDFRRWQLAAEAGGGLALFVRPDAARYEPSWAEVRLAVMPVGESPAKGAVKGFASYSSGFATYTAARRTLRVELLKCRGRAAGSSAEVSIDDATHPLPVAARVVASTSEERARA